MGWAKFDDRWATHPKLLAAGLEGKGLDASAICWSAGQETDGFVPDSALPILAAGHRSPRRVADRLVAAGRWTRDDERGGYVIHDYLDYNPTRAEREAEREGKRRAGQAGGKRSAATRSHAGGASSGQAGAIPPASSRTQAGASLLLEPESKLAGAPPTRPDPYPPPRSSSEPPASPPEGAEEEELQTRKTQAARLVAERRLKARNGEPITNRSGWLRKVAGEVLDEHGQVLAELAGQGLNPAAMADAVDPAVAPSPHRPWEPPDDDEPVVAGEAALNRLAELRKRPA